jgi:CRP-like cAMP-binding protein
MTELQTKFASLSIFKELDAAELAPLAQRVQWFSVINGAILFSEGDLADDMFVLLSGCVGAFKQRNARGFRAPGPNRVVRTRAPGPH